MAILSKDAGMVAATPEDARYAEAAGYVKCATARVSANSGKWRGHPCPFYLSPETQVWLQEHGGYYTCPICYHSHDFLHELPWHGVPDEQFDDGWQAGGTTRIGFAPGVQGEIGEQLIKNEGELGPYGPITWWHEGGATSSSPLDGATAEWGIEVKTLGYDAQHHRFIPGRDKEKEGKMEQAKNMGKQGVLGVLVILDYRRSVADVWAREFPLGSKLTTYRTVSTPRLIEEIPFHNPLMDPDDPSPQVAGPDPNDEMPF